MKKKLDALAHFGSDFEELNTNKILVINGGGEVSDDITLLLIKDLPSRLDSSIVVAPRWRIKYPIPIIPRESI